MLEGESLIRFLETHDVVVEALFVLRSMSTLIFTGALSTQQNLAQYATAGAQHNFPEGHQTVRDGLPIGALLRRLRRA